MKKLMALFGILLITSVQASFSDEDIIPDWAQFPVKKLKEKNIISGNSDGTFRPHASVNRAEFCKILVNTTNVKKYIPIQSSFSDVESGDWFFDYVETAKKYGWVNGYDDGTFRPGNKINRAEISKILINAFEMQPESADKDQHWYDKFVRTLRNQSLFPHDANEQTFNPGHFPSRAEIVEQIYRFMKKTGKLSPNDLSEENEANNNTETSNDQSTTTNQTFNYTDDSAPQSSVAISSTAGTLNISKKSGGLKKIQVSSAQKEVKASQLYFQADKNPVEISAIQFRRIGNGSFNDFARAWIEIDGKEKSQKIIFDNDLINIPLDATYKINAGSKKEITLMVDLSGSGKKENSSRFVLYLPTWISANTDKKIGFFPFGGTDLEIK